MTASSVRRQARRLVCSAILAGAVGAGLCGATPAWAGKLTCLTGTDPEVADDLTEIAAVRLAIETSCECSSPNSVSLHASYVGCANSEIRRAVIRGDLRIQCLGTVKKYYAVSSCGLPRSKPAAPCITTSASGKLSCAIKPAAKCKGVPCTDFTSCEDAADTNGDGMIGTGDSGACGPDNLIPTQVLRWGSWVRRSRGCRSPI